MAYARRDLRQELGHVEWLKRHDEWASNDPPLCADGHEVQFFRARGSDPQLWHHILGHGWNYDWGVELPAWVFSQPDVDGSTASSFLICTSNILELPTSRSDCSSDVGETFDLWFNIAERWRQDGFETRYGIEPYQIGEFSSFSRHYHNALLKLNDPAPWYLPEKAYGPFNGPVPPRPSDVVMDENGRLRRPFERWHEERYG